MMAPMYAAFGVGTAFGPAIGGMIGSAYGLHAPFIFVGGAMMSAGVLNYFTMKETKAPTPAGQPLNLVRELRDMMRQWRASIADRSIRSILVLNTTFWWAHSGAQMTIVPFVLSDRFGFTLNNLGAIYTMTSLIHVLSAQPCAWLADRYGRRTMVIPGISTVCACLAGLPYVTSTEHVVGLLALWSLGGAMLGTAPLAQVVDQASAGTRAQAMALFRSSGDLGLLLGGATLGSLAQTTSLQVATAVPAVLLTVAGIGYARRALDLRKDE